MLRLNWRSGLRVSTLSWGILYDSMMPPTPVWSKKPSFNPLLRNSLWFVTYTGFLGNWWHRFNPLLRNSLWFGCHRGNQKDYEGEFQPSLEEFFMIPVFSTLLISGYMPMVSTLSWGILYDSSPRSWRQVFLVRICVVSTLSWGILYDSWLWKHPWISTARRFNPLLRNSLWFWAKSQIEVCF